MSEIKFGTDGWRGVIAGDFNIKNGLPAEVFNHKGTKNHEG